MEEPEEQLRIRRCEPTVKLGACRASRQRTCVSESERPMRKNSKQIRHARARPVKSFTAPGRKCGHWPKKPVRTRPESCNESLNHAHRRRGRRKAGKTEGGEDGRRGRRKAGKTEGDALSAISKVWPLLASRVSPGAARQRWVEHEAVYGKRATGMPRNAWKGEPGGEAAAFSVPYEAALHGARDVVVRGAAGRDAAAAQDLVVALVHLGAAAVLLHLGVERSHRRAAREARIQGRRREER
eukprot:scaffold207_cov267-Pinguiococcus_pyrenoidosus.AAC.32